MRRSIGPPALRLASATAGPLLTLVAVLILTTANLAVAAGSGRVMPSMVPAVKGPCLGPSAPSLAAGNLVLLGNATPVPAVSGVAVYVDYYYTEVQKFGNTTTTTCVPTSASGATRAGGNLSVTLTVPSNRCTPTACVDYMGPFGPLGYGTSGPPVGFTELDPTTGHSPGTIQWATDLSSARLNRTGTEVVSTNAPVDVSATAWGATGSPAPPPLTYTWSLAGLGWTPSATQGPDIVVAGADTGWTGSLSVTVQATYGSTTETARSPVLSLLPVATQVRSATASPAPVDPGAPVTFQAVGVGAGGYSYSFTIDPGLGVGPASGPCQSVPAPNGTANLLCQVSTTYPTPGTASPTASISNGFSTGQLSLGPVSIRPVEALTISAPTFATYPDRPIELTVSVNNGTGTAPYGPACLFLTGVRSLGCQSQNATVWRFNATFASTGAYRLLATVVDRFGENVSAPAVVAVVPLLMARANGSSTISLFANQTTPLSVVVAGGALPIATWWNLSGSSAYTCDGNLGFDGTITCPYPTSWPGVSNLTVTLRDALGSVAVVVFRITVTDAPAPPRPLGPSVLSGTSGWVIFGGVTALAAGVALVVRDVRRRLRAGSISGNAVEEDELERMARGREHLLSRADPAMPRRPDELVSGWTGPPVTPEEWAEWIAALVADRSLIPSRALDRRLVYRRAPDRPTAPTIQFDPTVLPARPSPLDEEPDSSTDTPGR